MQKVKILLIALLVVMIYAPSTLAKVETMTVSELKPGMKGISRTVISGTEIEEFDVELIGVLARGGFNGGPMILVKCSGDVIDATGGVAGGYSGSPVYFDGKLVGALAAAWPFSEQAIAGVTPIHEMLKNFNYPDEPEGEITIAKLDNPFEIDGRTIDSAVLCMDRNESERLQSELNDNTMVLLACKTPLYVNGVSPEFIDVIKEKLGSHFPYMEIMPGTGSRMASYAPSISIMEGPTEIEPGSAMGMQLVSGDIDLTAIGTVTWVDPDDPEKKILMFGHPFLSKGRVDAPLTSARIITAIPSIYHSNKLGEAIEVIGVSHQDRACAVSGYIGRTPDLVDVNFNITDLDQNRTRRYKFGVIRDEDMLTPLVMIPVMQGMMQTIDRSGQATAAVSFEVKGEGLAEPIAHKNMYFSSMGGFGALNEPLEVLSMLTTSNVYREVKVNEINIDVEITENRQTLDIVEIDFFEEEKKKEKSENVELNKTEMNKTAGLMAESGNLIGRELQVIPESDVEAAAMPKPMPPLPPPGSDIKKFAPGDTIKVKAMIKPYREEIYEEYLEIRIPDDIKTGMTQLEIRGGGGFGNRFMGGPSAFMAMMGTMMPIQMAPGGQAEEPPKTLDEVIEHFMERDNNNELIIELIRPPETDPKKAKENKDNKPEPIKSVEATNKVIYGTFHLPLEIKKPDGEEEKGETPEIESDAAKKEKKKSSSKSSKSWKTDYRSR